MGWKTAAVLSVAGGVVGYAVWLRPWHLRWGATDDEVTMTLPGDELVKRPTLNTTRAITVDAPPEKVWPWIAQLGQDKAGFYSYAWLENLVGCEMVNADQVWPEWQTVEPGSEVWLHPKAPPLTVRVVDPGRTLVLSDDWCFHLQPLNGGQQTRLIVRGRGIFAYPDLGPIGNFIYWRGIFEPAHFIMERKMMLGIKERAERRTYDRRFSVSFSEIPVEDTGDHRH